MFRNGNSTSQGNDMLQFDHKFFFFFSLANYVLWHIVYSIALYMINTQTIILLQQYYFILL